MKAFLMVAYFIVISNAYYTTLTKEPETPPQYKQLSITVVGAEIVNQLR